MSTNGVAPDTVMVSETVPTCSSAFTVAVNAAGNSIPSRFTVLKPVNAKVTA